MDRIARPGLRRRCAAQRASGTSFNLFNRPMNSPADIRDALAADMTALGRRARAAAAQMAKAATRTKDDALRAIAAAIRAQRAVIQA